MTTERWLAKCQGFDLEIEDHGILVLHGVFVGENVGQGLGYPVDAAFLMRFLCAVGVTRLKAVDGKSVWVTSEDGGGIVKIEPLHKGDGEPFSIPAWQKWFQERGCKASPYELRTGKRP